MKIASAVLNHLYCAKIPTGDSMTGSKFSRAACCMATICLALVLLAGFAPSANAQAAAPAAMAPGATEDYRIGPGDSLNIFVWHNAELSTTVPVRPDGKISMPLVEDIVCAGKTPTELARYIETRLTKFITNPIVTVVVTAFAGTYDQQVRILGEAAEPKAFAYRDNMTVLDAMIAVGGLTRFASGNRATLVRNINGRQTQTTLRLDDLIKDGDISANVPLKPGDVIIIPQSFF
jgi:polysaccharide biosynthesis/export protein